MYTNTLSLSDDKFGKVSNSQTRTTDVVKLEENLSIKNEGKGEIARYEQFLLFPQYFQKSLWVRTLDSMNKKMSIKKTDAVIVK